MKYFPECSTKSIIVNGADVMVPRNIDYVTINMNQTVQGWEHEPYLWDGYWHSDKSRPIRLGTVELEAGDLWTNAFKVKK